VQLQALTGVTFVGATRRAAATTVFFILHCLGLCVVFILSCWVYLPAPTARFICIGLQAGVMYLLCGWVAPALWHNYYCGGGEMCTDLR